MSTYRNLIASAVALGTIGSAQAQGLKPAEARSIDLREVSGVAYYTVERDGFHVVATLAQGNDGMPMRVESVLAPGQRIRLSVSNGVGVSPDSVEIARENDRVLVRKTAQLTH